MQMKFHTQIDQCQQCSKSTLKGIELICSLSNKKENFYGECKSFSKGITNAEVKNEPILKVKKTENYQSSSHMNYSKNSEDVRSNGEIKSKTVIGIFMIIGAIIWFIVGLSMGIIFYYPAILFILGAVNIIRGISKV